ncbi:MAG: 1,2-phenylacetyl-CoA epoxidase subunit PaaD [Cyclobacteriaceae bacterium]
MIEEKVQIEKLWEILESVKDPEIPVLSVVDLGVVREISEQSGQVIVTITPTYSGCPAMNVIEEDIKSTLQQSGYEVTVETVLSPAWTTDWLSANGRKKLEEFGIAPPAEGSQNKRVLFGDEPIVRCPNCKSTATKMVSQFGSTACKAHYKCKDCLEPFDYFKCI